MRFGQFAAKPGQIESRIDPPNQVIVRHRIKSKEETFERVVAEDLLSRSN